jgi:hypothetical protein
VVAQGPTIEGTLGLMYDFAYKWMTEEQRTTCRKALVKATAGMTTIGCETLHALQTNSSNWISWSGRMIFCAAAIEGEEGYDPLTYKRASDAMTGYVGAYFDTGEAYEGWGKNFTFMEHLVIMAKRGKDVLASKHLRAAYQRYYVAAMNPWGADEKGNGFTFCDSLGGTSNRVSRNADVMAYRFFFPKDPAADFVYRTQINEDYTNLTEKNGVNIRHPFGYTDALVCALYATDFDEKKTWEQAKAEVVKGKPLSLFSEDTCNLITRSSWEGDALYLNYLNRAVPGGHQYSDRSHFSLYADGRYWGIYQTLRQVNEQYMPYNRSVVMNGEDGPQTAPARCAAYSDTAEATFIATDIKPAWDWIDARWTPVKDKSKLENHPYSYNDMRLHRSALPWMEIPMTQLPDWYNSEKPASKGAVAVGQAPWYRRENPVKYAYRTAGLVRGKHAYAVVVDDLARGTAASEWTWNMTVAKDVAVTSARLTPEVSLKGRSSADIVLSETGAAGGVRRNLLVRVVDAARLDESKPGVIEMQRTPNPPFKEPIEIPRLRIASQAVSPGYKVLMVPFREGEALPVTKWSADGKTVRVAWGDQVDEIEFAAGEDGRTRVTVRREGKEVGGIR